MKSGHLQSDSCVVFVYGVALKMVYKYFFYIYYVLLIYVVIFIFKESRPVKKIFSNGACSRIVRITTNRGKV